MREIDAQVKKSSTRRGGTGESSNLKVEGLSIIENYLQTKADGLVAKLQEQNLCVTAWL